MKLCPTYGCWEAVACPFERRFARTTRRSRMQRPSVKSRRNFLLGSAAAAVSAWLPRPALAADPLKIGLIIPLTGPFASTGRQLEAAVRLYMQTTGDTGGGKQLELTVTDITAVAPEQNKRTAD